MDIVIYVWLIVFLAIYSQFSLLATVTLFSIGIGFSSAGVCDDDGGICAAVYVLVTLVFLGLLLWELFLICHTRPGKPISRSCQNVYCNVLFGCVIVFITGTSFVMSIVWFALQCSARSGYYCQENLPVVQYMFISGFSILFILTIIWMVILIYTSCKKESPEERRLILGKHWTISKTGTA